MRKYSDRLRRRMIVTALFGLALIVSLAPTPTAAQWTAAQRAACEGDARRLCSQHLANAGALNACMNRNASRVSSRCRAAMGGKKKKAG
jgi:hypothetical protein